MKSNVNEVKRKNDIEKYFIHIWQKTVNLSSSNRSKICKKNTKPKGSQYFYSFFFQMIFPVNISSKYFQKNIVYFISV